MFVEDKTSQKQIDESSAEVVFYTSRQNRKTDGIKIMWCRKLFITTRDSHSCLCRMFPKLLWYHQTPGGCLVIQCIEFSKGFDKQAKQVCIGNKLPKADAIKPISKHAGYLGEIERLFKCRRKSDSFVG